MANLYVYSGAAGAGTGADWANAYTTITAAATASTAGDDIWVASDHAESTAAAITPTFAGTLAAPTKVYSVNRAGSVPPVAADLLAGASITVTGGSSITITGNIYVYGLILNAGTGAVSPTISLGGAAQRQTWEECYYNIPATGASGRIALSGQSSSYVQHKNCKVSFGATGQGLSLSGKCEWWNDNSHPAIDAASTLPTTFIPVGASFAESTLRGLDLSLLGSGKTLVGASIISLIRFIGCKLGASVTVAAAPTNAYAVGHEVVGSSDTTAPYRNEKGAPRGALTTETTIVRTGGALGPDSTPVSWKIVTTANASRFFPFATFEVDVPYNTTGAARTITFHTVTDGVTLTDAEAWVEVDYPGVASSPLLYTVSDGAATVLTTGANQTTSTETWTTTGLTTPVYQKLSATFTPQMAGLVRARLMIGKASATVYVCPLCEIG